VSDAARHVIERRPPSLVVARPLLASRQLFSADGHFRRRISTRLAFSAERSAWHAREFSV